ncbi:ABC transporter permease [Buchananella felis]|uniref:ABC transporter permease n=1 Tax=Buchananella felis TaxID=3231492 RepID=UPI0035278327
MSAEQQAYKTPGISSGLFEVFKNPFLTGLIVHKELRARYRGSLFGMLWSYAKPLTQFTVFYFAIGVFMRMNKAIPDYVIYMFSGVILINYFSEVLGNATRAVVGNGALVKKIYLPRELFPVSALWVALVHFVPQLVVLVAGALLFGWAPSLTQIAAILVGFLIVSCFALGLGLFAGALNVFYRDAENFVDLALMLVTWISPVLYTWQMVYEVASSKGMEWIWYLYQLNPISVAVELFHYGFWQSATTPPEISALPPSMFNHTAIAALVSLLTLVVGELYFRRADARFAQEL